MKILSIETSCDETAIAIGEVKNDKIKILSHVVSSQIKLHSKWGGVVPDLASREHLKNLLPVMKAACTGAGFKNAQELEKNIDLIGVTQGPGLIPSLLMGVNFAKALSYSWKKPLIPINHMEGHIYSSWVEAIPKNQLLEDRPFPLLALLISGGHTMLVEVSEHLKYKILGETLDDAVGEAFDKVARILDLGYPGGPALSKMAQKGKPDFQFSVPLKNSKNLNFSFSGLKTAVLYKALELVNMGKSLKEIVKQSPKPDLKIPLTQKQKQDIARAFEDVAIESLMFKTKKTLSKKKYKLAIIGGGVAANSLLRKRWIEELPKEFPGLKVSLPPIELTGDNAAMFLPVIYLKWMKAKREKKTEKYLNTWKSLEANASFNL